jgi:hypothetical protein
MRAIAFHEDSGTPVLRSGWLSLILSKVVKSGLPRRVTYRRSYNQNYHVNGLKNVVTGITVIRP